MGGLNYSRRRRLYLFWSSVLLIVLGMLRIWDAEQKHGQLRNESLTMLTTKSGSDEPLILLYNVMQGFPDWWSHWDNYEGSNVVKVLRDCPVKCLFAFDHYFLKSADMVLVSLAYYAGFGGKPVDLTMHSKRDQIWAGFNWESPLYGDHYEAVDSIMDWAVTYKRGSDIFLPYGAFYPVTSTNESTSLGATPESIFKRKKLATWLVSHCGAASGRDLLFQTLQRYIPVDVYGNCSQVACPESDQLSCRDYMGQNYKFYLAFENSLCEDYVTEKFFLAYYHNMVPVTFGWANYSLYGPPASYINALDYDSVEDLANHLLYLDRNDEEYLKYFSWRGKYKIQTFSLNDGMCTVCRTLADFVRRAGKYPQNHAKFQRNGEKPGYPSFVKWYASLAEGKSSQVRRIGGKVILNTTTACVVPGMLPALQKWIQGERLTSGSG